nr:MAG TPA: hypothetical protein [Caudoviricetes sp.]
MAKNRRALFAYTRSKAKHRLPANNQRRKAPRPEAKEIES